jgi:signal transduction histidine kinase
MHAVRNYVTNLIPDRVCRSFFWLLAGTSLATAILGPFVGAAAYYGAYGTPLLLSYFRFLLANSLGLSIGCVVIAMLLHRRIAPGLPLRAAIKYTVIFALVAGLARFAVVYALRVAPAPGGNGYLNSAIQLAIILLIFGVVIVGLTFAAARETALEASFTELARSQQALLHEEELVRGHVFDQLHGTVQAEIVSARRSLMDLAEGATDESLKRELLAIEERLDATYQSSIRSIAVALSPASLDAGLLPAVRELAARVEGATTLTVDVDPLVTVLDDPMHGGLHRQLRGGAFRVVEEAVSNAMRHAQAREVHVHISTQLQEGTPMLLLSIRNATPARVDVVEGEGLRRMTTRVAALGGELAFIPDEREFQVLVTLPLERSEEGRVLA